MLLPTFVWRKRSSLADKGAEASTNDARDIGQRTGSYPTDGHADREANCGWNTTSAK